jgi:hypothetical protein
MNIHKTKEEADAYWSIIRQTEDLTSILSRKELLIDFINSLPARKEATLKECAELYEDAQDIAELEMHYAHIDNALKYALRLIEGEVYTQTDKVVKYVDNYRYEYDMEYKLRNEKFSNATKPFDDEKPF